MPEQLKNIFFPKSFYHKLEKELAKFYPQFDTLKFNKLIFTKDFKALALKAKMRHSTEALGKTLPQDFKKAIDVLLKVEKEFDGFEHLIFSDFVERYGLDDFSTSIKALEVFTRSTAEFAIKPFIIKYPGKTMAQMLKWSKSPHDYVRRLSSEGCRPRGPWAMALPAFKKDPSPILPILENLKNDPSENVRKSVANNLNDISKDNPEIVLRLAKKWIGKSYETDKIIKHALRGLLKKANPDAMNLFGFGNVDSVKINNLSMQHSSIKIGESTEFAFELKVKGNKKLKLRLEYVIDFVKKTGKISPKIFQIKEEIFSPGTYMIKRKLDFQDRTTRKHNPGKHIFTIIVNGEKTSHINFLLQQS